MTLPFTDSHAILMSSYLSTLLSVYCNQKWNYEEDKFRVNYGFKNFFFIPAYRRLTIYHLTLFSRLQKNLDLPFNLSFSSHLSARFK